MNYYPKIQKPRFLACLLAGILAWSLSSASLSLRGADAPAPSPAQGLKVFTIGHSFHASWLPGWLAQVEAETDIKGHEQIGVSMIGGSRVIQHWMLPDDKNPAKTALMTGKVEWLTMSPMLSPDDGIDNFATLGLKYNPNLKITLQEFWLPFDRLDCFGERSYGDQAKQLRNWEDAPPPPDDPRKGNYDTSHFNIPTADQIDKLYAPYFAKMNAFVEEENKKLGKQVIYVVPVGQAVAALRRMIIEGKLPEIKQQSDLFVDKLGHPRAVIAALSAYCHFAVIYHRNPEGLPLLPGLAKEHRSQELNLVLQKLAWDAVTQNPLSGVK